MFVISLFIALTRMTVRISLQHALFTLKMVSASSLSRVFPFEERRTGGRKRRKCSFDDEVNPSSFKPQKRRFFCLNFPFISRHPFSLPFAFVRSPPPSFWHFASASETTTTNRERGKIMIPMKPTTRTNEMCTQSERERTSKIWNDMKNYNFGRTIPLELSSGRPFVSISLFSLSPQLASAVQ